MVVTCNTHTKKMYILYLILGLSVQSLRMLSPMSEQFEIGALGMLYYNIFYMSIYGIKMPKRLKL